MGKRKQASSRARTAAPPRAARGLQRQRLIEACISALHVHGPSNTTVERVTAIAKMSPGIVRFYFASKAAMLVASLQFLADEFEQQLLAPVAQLKDTPVIALQTLVQLYLDPQLASPRKVSVWYSFWGEASSRGEYYDLCGQKDASFAALTREIIARLILQTGQTQLDADAIALGLIGVLEVLWQDIAFQDEKQINRTEVKRRAMSYLQSVFPGQFEGARATQGVQPDSPHGTARSLLPTSNHWQLVAHVAQLATAERSLCIEIAGRQVRIARVRGSIGVESLRAGGTARGGARRATYKPTDIEISERDGFIFLRIVPRG